MHDKSLRLTLLLGGLAMLGPFATDTYFPSFPAIAREFDVGALGMQQTLSVYLFAYSLMSLFWGTLSDSLGRRPIVLFALGLFCIGSIGCAVSDRLSILLGFRIVQGLSAGAGMVVGQAIVRDRFSGADAQRLVANILMVFGLAPALAPILGGWLQVMFGWRASFAFMAIFSVALITACGWALPESLAAASRRPLRLSAIMKGYFSAIVHPHFLLRCLAMGCAFGGFALYISAAADFVIRILKLPPTAFGWLFLPLIGGLVLGSSVSGRLAHRLSSGAMIRMGFAVMAAAATANLIYTFSLPAAVPWAVLPIMVYTFGLALAVPGMTMMTLGIFPEMRGLAASLQNFLQMLIFAVISGAVAPALFGSAFKLAAGASVGLLFAALFWSLGTRHETVPTPRQGKPDPALTTEMKE
jgi:DHA1 family bicyclomycin/chloramphenicol resistance-like MFS transporter